MYLTILLSSGVLCLVVGNNLQHKVWGIVLCSTAAVGFLSPPFSFTIQSFLMNCLLFLLHLVLLALSPVQILLLRSGPPVTDGNSIVVQYLPSPDEDGNENIIVE